MSKLKFKYENLSLIQVWILELCLNHSFCKADAKMLRFTKARSLSSPPYWRDTLSCWHSEKWKTSLRSPSPASQVTVSCSGRFESKVGLDRKPQIFQFASRFHWIFRFAAACDFAVKSARGACGHSRSQTRWSQARRLFFENLRIKKHSRLSDRSLNDRTLVKRNIFESALVLYYYQEYYSLICFTFE